MIKLKPTLTLKLILICATAGVVMNFAFWGLIVKFRDRVPGIIPQSIVSAYGSNYQIPERPTLYQMTMRLKYAQDIMNAIHQDPTREAFLKHVGAEPIEARFESMHNSWTTSESLPSLKDALAEGAAIWPYRDFHVTETWIARRDGEVQWAVYFPKDWRTSLHNDSRLIFAVLINFSICAIMLWIFVLWQTRPLRDLSRAALEASRGNFNIKIPVHRNSALADLATAFNRMTGHVVQLLKAKDDMISAVSHELRAPLTRIRLELSINNGRNIENIRRDLDAIEAMITDILEAKQVESHHARLQMQDVDIKSIFEQIVEFYPLVRPRIEIKLIGPIETIVADSPRLFRVVRNLVENAAKYSSERILLEAQNRDGGVEIRVRDRGQGVAEEHLKQIFEPFFRGDSSKKGGFGFGLYLCKIIIAAHGGTISAANNPDGGLSVTVFLPQQKHSPHPKPS